MTIVLLQAGSVADDVVALAADWARAGLIRDAYWVLPGDLKVPTGPGMLGATARLPGAGRSLDLFRALADADVDLVRLLRLVVVTGSASEVSQEPGLADALESALDRILPMPTSVAESGGRAREAVRRVRSLVVVPTSEVTALPRSLLHRGWESHFLASPEDRSGPLSGSRYVTRDNVAGHALSAAAAVGGLWVGQGGGLADAPPVSSDSGEPRVTVLRSFVRVATGGDVTNEVYRRALSGGAGTLPSAPFPVAPAPDVAGALTEACDALSEHVLSRWVRSRPPPPSGTVHLVTTASVPRSWWRHFKEMLLMLPSLVRTRLGESWALILQFIVVGSRTGTVVDARAATDSQIEVPYADREADTVLVQVSRGAEEALSELREVRRRVAQPADPTPGAWQTIRQGAFALLDAGLLPDVGEDGPGDTPGGSFPRMSRGATRHVLTDVSRVFPDPRDVFEVSERTAELLGTDASDGEAVGARVAACDPEGAERCGAALERLERELVEAAAGPVAPAASGSEQHVQAETRPPWWRRLWLRLRRLVWRVLRRTPPAEQSPDAPVSADAEAPLPPPSPMAVEPEPEPDPGRAAPDAVGVGLRAVRSDRTRLATWLQRRNPCLMWCLAQRFRGAGSQYLDQLAQDEETLSRLAAVDRGAYGEAAFRLARVWTGLVAGVPLVIGFLLLWTGLTGLGTCLSFALLTALLVILLGEVARRWQMLALLGLWLVVVVVVLWAELVHWEFQEELNTTVVVACTGLWVVRVFWVWAKGVDVASVYSLLVVSVAVLGAAVVVQRSIDRDIPLEAWPAVIVPVAAAFLLADTFTSYRKKVGAWITAMREEAATVATAVESATRAGDLARQSAYLARMTPEWSDVLGEVAFRPFGESEPSVDGDRTGIMDAVVPVASVGRIAAPLDEVEINPLVGDVSRRIRRAGWLTDTYGRLAGQFPPWLQAADGRLVGKDVPFLDDDLGLEDAYSSVAIFRRALVAGHLENAIRTDLAVDVEQVCAQQPGLRLLGSRKGSESPPEWLSRLFPREELLMMDPTIWTPAALVKGAHRVASCLVVAPGDIIPPKQGSAVDWREVTTSTGLDEEYVVRVLRFDRTVAVEPESLSLFLEPPGPPEDGPSPSGVPGSRVLGL